MNQTHEEFMMTKRAKKDAEELRRAHIEADLSIIIEKVNAAIENTEEEYARKLITNVMLELLSLLNQFESE